jgi:hypothetical protein
MAEQPSARKAKPGRPVRRMPVRTCVACRQAQGKRELVRVVRTLSGPVEVDPTGKKAGRGAYLHPQKSCWQLAFKKHALEHALKTTIGPENLAALEEYASHLE